MAMYESTSAGYMRNARKFWIRSAVASALMALPVWVQAADLSVAPVLLEGESSPGMSAPTPVASPAAAPLSLQGYAQWRSPTRTLEMVGFGTPTVRSSFGTGLPLKDALRLILPQGWRIYAQTGVSGSVPVTWKEKDTPWTDALRDVLRQAGLIATVNWPHQAILLRVKPQPKVPPLDTQGYAKWGSSSGSGMPSHFHEGNAVVLGSGLNGATPVFMLNRGNLILTDLKEWAKQSGWTVVWNVPEDWEVPNTTSFGGDFQQAVTQVVQALSSNGANVHAVFHTANNTVVISGAGGGE